MKKLIVAFALTAMIGLSSCKQDWVCQCVNKDNSAVTNTPINGGTFIHAEHACHSMSGNCSLITESR
jgi:hypothetical protein